MKNLKIKKNKGFTLIEMIVVISIIAILAAIIAATINKNIRQTRIEKARTDILQLVTAINLARLNTGAITVSEVTETYGTSWGRDASVYARSLDNISKKSGINVRNMKADPWNYPYLIIEWENPNASSGTCDVDRIGSEDHIYYHFPYVTDYCKAHPSPYNFYPKWEYKYAADMEPDCNGHWWCAFGF